jgi:hypothetical protein
VSGFVIEENEYRITLRFPHVEQRIVLSCGQSGQRRQSLYIDTNWNIAIQKYMYIKNQRLTTTIGFVDKENIIALVVSGLIL